MTRPPFRSGFVAVRTVGDVLRTNLCRYPNAEGGTNAGWGVFGSSVITSSTEQAHTGTRSYKVVCTGLAVGEGIGQLVSLAEGVASSGVAGPETLSLWLYSPNDVPFALVAEEYVPGGSLVAVRGTTDFVTVAGWQRVSVTGTKGTATNVMRLTLRTRVSPQSVTFYVDDVLCETGATLGDAFDGDTPGDGLDTVEYVWTGTQHASTSEAREVVWVETDAPVPPPVGSPLLIATPPGPPPNPAVVPGWDRMRHIWTGGDGSVWRLHEPDGGVFLVREGLRGLGMPKAKHYRDTSPALHGARHRGLIYEPRSVFWPVHLFHDGSSHEWAKLDRAFWRSFDPEEEGTWTVEVPGLSKRSIRLRFDGDGDWAPSSDPTFYGWANYGVNLQADDPLWYDEPVVYPFEAVTPVEFFGGLTAGAPIVTITKSSSLAAASVSNPGDVEAWPVVELIGPLSSATVTVAGKVLEVPFAIAAGKTLVLDYDPETRSAIDSDGNDRWEDLGAIAWGTIPKHSTNVSIGLALSGAGSARVTITPAYLRAW